MRARSKCTEQAPKCGCGEAGSSSSGKHISLSLATSRNRSNNLTTLQNHPLVSVNPSPSNLPQRPVPQEVPPPPLQEPPHPHQ